MDGRLVVGPDTAEPLAVRQLDVIAADGVERLLATVPDVRTRRGDQFLGGGEVGLGIAGARLFLTWNLLGPADLIGVENRVVRSMKNLFFFSSPVSSSVTVFVTGRAEDDVRAPLSRLDVGGTFLDLATERAPLAIGRPPPAVKAVLHCGDEQ